MEEVGGTPQKQKWTVWFVRAALLLLILFAFLVAIELMKEAFGLLGNDLANNIIQATSNPFVGLFIGLLSTAIIQSSSVTTSMVVSIVAAGNLSLESAVSIIMGANIGTTITSTIVSIGYIIEKKEFRKAFSAAASHSLFNLMSTVLFFPLEYYFQFLSRSARWLASWASSTNGISINIFQISVQPVAGLLKGGLNNSPLLLLAISGLLLILSIRYFAPLLRDIILSDSERYVEKYFFNLPSQALASGVFLTAALRSSAITTSLVLPLVATDRVTLKKAFPFIMGANIGTTITALLAAISRSDAALSVALVHLLFNVMGTGVFFPFPWIRNIPIQLSKALANLVTENRLIGLAYILLTFFLLPFVLIYLAGRS
jgi:sodium-dependent phosphate cotransporter